MITDQELMAMAKQNRVQIRSMSDLACFKEEMVKCGLINLDTLDLPYELYLMNQINQQLNLSLDEAKISNQKIDAICDGVKRLVERLPEPISKFKTKRGLQKAEVNDQLYRNLCVD